LIKQDMTGNKTVNENDPPLPLHAMNDGNHSDLAKSSSPTKADLRRSLLKARQSLPQSVWREKSDRLCAHLQRWEGFQRSHTILAYLSFRQEPDLSPLFVTPYRWGLPRCVGKSLSWHLWSPQFPLQAGSYGILEPQAEAPLIQPQEVDLILVPAVACDVRGYRLGYGGGFYDRLLSTPAWKNKPTIGIVFEFARLPQLPNDPWDRRLSGICTEFGLFLKP
jgi:5-formyltetrahydrofolate cyclo-ligase